MYEYYSGRKDATTLFAPNSSVLRVTILSIRVVLPGGGLKGTVVQQAKLQGIMRHCKNQDTKPFKCSASYNIAKQSSGTHRIDYAGVSPNMVKVCHLI